MSRLARLWRLPRPRRGPGTPVLLVLTAAVLVGLGSWFLAEARAAASGGADGNAALVDTGLTTEVSGQVGEALERVFSYSYDDMAATERAAEQVLAGSAVQDYDLLFGQVRDKAPEQKLVLSTTVSVSGVRTVDSSSAHLLVFLDQTATRVDTGKSNATAAVLSVDAERMDGRWKITGLVPR
ncbi:hypothetical protein [Amycolatopsis aidingensis]|uniref:hypothetical protein n=1 Tax=Amycolatopsis aidingensis TaxID=2842453 RepID=UPI001C0C047C|nr:hypothetical protein [Amycolatopsis aidingensis]